MVVKVSHAYADFKASALLHLNTLVVNELLHWILGCSLYIRLGDGGLVTGGKDILA